MDRRDFTLKVLGFGAYSSLVPEVSAAADRVGVQALNELAVAPYTVAVDNLTIHLDGAGRIAGCLIGPRKLERMLSGETRLEGCRTDGPASARRLEGGGIEFTSRLLGPDQKHCKMLQRFSPGQASVRWEVDLLSDEEPWTVPIATKLRWPEPNRAQFWTSWLGVDEQWQDPLQPQPMSKCSWACSWTYGPYAGVGGFCLPLASILETQEEIGLSLVLSPEDPILELSLTTDAEGVVMFRRLDRRLGQGRTVKFAADIVAHEAGWRGGLRWMVQRYRSFFDPPNPAVQEMAGTGAYSGWSGSIDVARLKRMAFTVLWEAAFDWPYLGMYFPPVKEDETWWSAGYDSGGDQLPELSNQVSYRVLNDRARMLRKEGFYYLSYYNFDGWGWTDVYSLKTLNRNIPEKYLWTDPVTFLRRRIGDGVWRDEAGKEANLSGLVVMDSSGPDYEADVLEQARRQIEKIPDSSGLAIDRIWWGVDLTTSGARPVNFGADDIVGWYNGRPGRHFGVSWKKTLSKLGPLMHGAGKVIFYNPCMSYRLDLMREVDGFFGEIWPTAHGYTCLNGTGFLALRKPGIVWTVDSASLNPNPDAYFQRHLYMGVYPMVPYPKNDHSITPDPAADSQYLDYGPLLAAMRGKKWVLEPHAIEVENEAAKANLFEVARGYAAPVVFGGEAEWVTVRIRNLSGLRHEPRCEALHPGVEEPQVVHSSFRHDVLEIQVPLKRGCAVLRITNGSY